MNFVSTYMRYPPSSSHVSKSYTARNIEALRKLSRYWKLFFKASLVDVYLLMNKARTMSCMIFSEYPLIKYFTILQFLKHPLTVKHY